MRFYVDASRPRCPGDKGKVERCILGHRQGFDPTGEDWRDLGELQAYTDQAVLESARRRTRPVTGESVWASYEAERRFLGSLLVSIPEPFDLVAQRRVGLDATVRFEGRT